MILIKGNLELQRMNSPSKVIKVFFHSAPDLSPAYIYKLFRAASAFVNLGAEFIRCALGKSYYFPPFFANIS